MLQTLVAIAFAVASSSAHADGASVSRFGVRVADDDRGATYELRDLRGELVDRCHPPPCTLAGDDGLYRVVALRDVGRTEVAVTLDRDLAIEREDANYWGLVAGVPLVALGTLLAVEAPFSATNFGESEPTSSSRKQAWALLAFGASLAAGGVVLIATSHASRLEVTPRARLALSAAPTAGGGALQLVGAF